MDNKIDKHEFWENLIYRARYSPAVIKSKINAYLFENSLGEVDAIDEFIECACFSILNLHKKKILSKGIAKNANSGEYEVLRFLQILKFIYSSHVESDMYSSFKSIIEDGEPLDGIPFSVNIVGHMIYLSSNNSKAASCEQNNIITSQMMKIFSKSIYPTSDEGKIAFSILGKLNNLIKEVSRFRKDITEDSETANISLKRLYELTKAFINDGETPEEAIEIAIKEYNESFYAFIDVIKSSRDKNVLREMKYDILDEAISVIDEDIKPEYLNYFKLI